MRGDPGDQFVGGMGQQIALEGRQTEGLVQVGVDLGLPGLPAQAEVVQPQLVPGDPGTVDGLAQQAGLFSGHGVIIHPR